MAASVTIDLPAHIPAVCVASAARDYKMEPLFILAVIRQESSGRLGLVTRNTNGTVDIGPAGMNSGSWAKKMRDQYGIDPDDLTNNMCQALRSAAFAIRSESLRHGCAGDLWCGVGYYHSATPYHRINYVNAIHRNMREMVRKGGF